MGTPDALAVVLAVKDDRWDILAMVWVGIVATLAVVAVAVGTRWGDRVRWDAFRTPAVHRVDRATRQRITRSVREGQHLAGDDDALARDYADWLVARRRSGALAVATLGVPTLAIAGFDVGGGWLEAIFAVACVIAVATFARNLHLSRLGRRYLEGNLDRPPSSVPPGKMRRSEPERGQFSGGAPACRPRSARARPQALATSPSSAEL